MSSAIFFGFLGVTLYCRLVRLKLKVNLVREGGEGEEEEEEEEEEKEELKDEERG